MGEIPSTFIIMKLYKTKYELTEYVEDDEESAFLTGTVTMREGRFTSAEITECNLFGMPDVNRVREFLDIVEKKIGGVKDE
jgi:hypothetical protein